MNKLIRYYRGSSDLEVYNSLLISGICPDVKSRYFMAQLTQASREGYLSVIIDFGRTGDFAGLLNRCGYSAPKMFVAGSENYRDLFHAGSLPVKRAIFHLRNHAARTGYDRVLCSNMTALLSFLADLEMEEDHSHTVGELLDKFSNQDKLEQILEEYVRHGRISVYKARDYIQKYLEYISAGVTADVLLDELHFLMTPGNGKEDFSLLDMSHGEAVVLSAYENNSVDINDYMARVWNSDLIELANKNIPMLIGINSSYYSQIDRVYELVETLNDKPNVRFFYSVYDLFSGVSEERAKAFAKMFRYNIFSSHSFDSAVKISGLFSEHWVTRFDYADSRNHRIMKESLIDKIFGTDHTTTVSTSLVKESIFPAENIVDLAPEEYIVFDNFTNEVRTAYIRY